jgi:hypothetical protein
LQTSVRKSLASRVDRIVNAMNWLSGISWVSKGLAADSALEISKTPIRSTVRSTALSLMVFTRSIFTDS